MVSHRGLYADLGSRAIVGNFFRQYEEDLAMMWATRLGFMNSNANQETETYRMLGATPFPREWVGGRLADAMELHELAITNKTYEATLRVKVDDLRRDKTPQIRARISDLARGFADHWNSLVTTLITSNSTTGVYDGQNFFDTDHSIGDSGTIINNVAAAQVGALNVTTANNPSRTEAADIAIGLVQHMLGFKNEQGQPVHGTARQFTLMVPVNMYGAFLAATRSERLSGGESNFLINQDFAIDVVANPRLTTTTELYCFRTDGPVKPFILQEEAGVQVEVIGEGSEHAFKHNEHLYGAKAVRAAGYGEWLYALKATTS